MCHFDTDYLTADASGLEYQGSELSFDMSDMFALISGKNTEQCLEMS